jgi:hypothetical protein
LRAVVDEGVPRELVRLLRDRGCDIHSFPKTWKGTKNGRLLQLIEENGFDCLVTTDKNLNYQQNLANVALAVIVLPVQKLEQMESHIDTIADALRTLLPGRVDLLRFPSQA